MAGWTWCVIGIVLFVAELLLPSGFFLFLMGLSGLFVGLITLTGIPMDWSVQLIVFCFAALGLWYTCATKLKELFRGSARQSDGTTGQIVKVQGTIEPGEIGSGELWGSPWRIKNVGSSRLHVGNDAVVVNSEGVTLHVESTPRS